MRYIMKCMLTGAQNEVRCKPGATRAHGSFIDSIQESTADERQEALEALLDWYIDNYRDDEFEVSRLVKNPHLSCKIATQIRTNIELIDRTN